MDRRKLIWALAALLAVLAAALGLSLSQQKASPATIAKAEEAEEEQKEALQEACASNATYDRLKQVVFEQAVRIRNSDPDNLDVLATHSVVRMENPIVKSRDEELNVTVCTGRFVLEVPPGAERAFAGERRLVADVEYAAQAAADGSGLVYQLKGAEPIVYKLAAFDLQGQRFQPPGAPVETQLAEAEPLAPNTSQDQPAANVTSGPAQQAAPRPEPVPARAAPAPARTAARSSPSFDCRYARTRGEIMVCGSNRLAAQDRAMSSLFYSALSDADGQAKRALRTTRDRFLAYRDRCRDEACVSDAYDGRMREIRDIMAQSE